MGRRAGTTVEETRAAILDAASAEFSAHGYEGARLARIATNAGLSAGAIYNHYRSKADLLLAVVERSTAGALLRLLRSNDGDHPVEAITRLFDQVGDEMPLVAELILASRRDPDAGAALLSQLRSAERHMAEKVAVAQRDGMVASELSPDVIARFSLMVGLGAVLVGAADLPPTDPDDWARFILRLADGLGPKTTAKRAAR